MYQCFFTLYENHWLNNKKMKEREQLILPCSPCPSHLQVNYVIFHNWSMCLSGSISAACKDRKRTDTVPKGEGRKDRAEQEYMDDKKHECTAALHL